MDRSELVRIFSHIPPIETNRLRLRQLQIADCRDMYAYSCLSTVTRFLLWSPHPSEEYTKRYLTTVQRLYRSGAFFDWGIEWKETAQLIGTCGFTSLDPENEKGEIGYVLSPGFWGRGIATEAAMAVIEYGFTRLDLHRIEAKYIFGNDLSRRVMEKCGLKFEGIQREAMRIKGTFCDIGICSILQKEFVAKFGSSGKMFGEVRIK